MSTDSEQQPAETPATAQHPRRVAVLVVVASLALIADFVSKTLIVAHAEGKAPVELLGGALYINVIRNPGAAFSLATGMTWVLSLVALAVVGVLIWIAPRLRSIGWAIGLGLVLAGALGNLIDRIFRAPGPLRGHVVDFLQFGGPLNWFPIFNVADSCICVGGGLIVLMALLGKDYDGRSTRDKKDGS